MKCIRGFEKHGKLLDLKYDEILENLLYLAWSLMYSIVHDLDISQIRSYLSFKLVILAFEPWMKFDR